jgi:hypothetical protein
MGRPRTFDFKGDELRIVGFSFDEAMTFMRAAEGSVGYVGEELAAAPSVDVSAPMPVLADEPVVAPAASTKPTLDKNKIAAIAAGNPAKAPKAEAAPRRGRKAPKEEPVVEAPVEVDVDDPADFEVNAAGVEVPVGHADRVAAVHGKDPEMHLDEEDDEAEPEEAPKPKLALVKANGKSNGTNGTHAPLPQVLLDARKLRDVLSLLMEGDPESGMAAILSPDKLKERCNEIREQVPCLSRITDLDSRIDRTLEVMDMAGDVS